MAVFATSGMLIAGLFYVVIPHAYAEQTNDNPSLNILIKRQRVETKRLFSEIDKLDARNKHDFLSALERMYSSYNWIPYMKSAVQLRIISLLGEQPDRTSMSVVYRLLDKERKEGRAKNVRFDNDRRFFSSMSALIRVLEKDMSTDSMVALDKVVNDDTVHWFFRQKAYEVLLRHEASDKGIKDEREYAKWLLLHIKPSRGKTVSEWAGKGKKTMYGIQVGAVTHLLQGVGSGAKGEIESALNKAQGTKAPKEYIDTLERVLHRITINAPTNGLLIGNVQKEKVSDGESKKTYIVK